MSGHRGGRGGRRPGYNAPPKGLFVNGVWNCDCNPRQPAVHFQTKKEGQNKGRWFYSCQKPQGNADRCKFFLWDDDAKPREEHALLNNSRTEPAYSNETTPSKPRNIREPPPPYAPSIPLEQSKKRNRTIVEEDDEFAFGQGDREFTNELDQVMAAVETPRKTARIDTYTTPARRKLPWIREEDGVGHGLQTPQTGQRTPGDLFLNRFAAAEGSFLTPSKFNEHENDSHQTLTPASSPFNTPTPSRFREAGSNGRDDLVQDVFSLLHEANVNLSNQIETELRSVLSRHARKAEGFRKGQELVRLSVKTKEARISELEYRIALLESESGADDVEHLDP